MYLLGETISEAAAFSILPVGNHLHLKSAQPTGLLCLDDFLFHGPKHPGRDGWLENREVKEVISLLATYKTGENHPKIFTHVTMVRSEIPSLIYTC